MARQTKRLTRVDIKAILRHPKDGPLLLQMMAKAIIEVGRDNTKPIEVKNVV
jgi:hypothetical protein